MNVLKSFFMGLVNLRATMSLWSAIQKADKAHRKTGERFYVLPNIGNRKKPLIVMDRRNFRKLKQKGYISRLATVRDMELECFYCTPYRDGSGRLPSVAVALKRDMYYDWLRHVDDAPGPRRKRKDGSVRKFLKHKDQKEQKS